MEVDFLFVVIVLATFATAFLSSIFGMLGGLILMGILVSILSVGPAMVLHGLIQTTSNGYRAYQSKRHQMGNYLTLLLKYNFFDLSFFIAFQPSEILIIFALGVLPYIAWIVPKELSLDITKPFISIVAGGVVVFTNLIAGVGGPYLMYFFRE